MSALRLAIAFVVASFVSVTLVVVKAQAPAGMDVPSGPAAIAGVGTSARHCVAGDAANVHGLGYVTSGTSYTITFDSDITLQTAVSRLDLDGDQSSSAYGTPDLRFTASTSGTMALYVGGQGRSGCYRYTVEITPSAAGSARDTSVAAPISSSR